MEIMVSREMGELIMGLFDDLFDFNDDGKVDAMELAFGMEMIEEIDKNEDGEWNEGEDW